ncbi:metal ABC transporter substrate-binding protein [Microbacterium amylolyticum]|uniref:Manganese transport system substrate-binding protein n=1 Tax=Microbacterium amylolyticum TaxID=936337 RepID=A0ABS4ZGC8_9MICO|nr:metal ABC transporter substrate-binding protein [Microbacterium amylolyticum]MBP2436035.1 manganese transport system substrate-binding protein [Microbacterium amylolyticum]
MPKNRLSALLVLPAVALVAASCSATESATGGASDERPVVLTTFTVLADIAQNVGGEHIQVQSLMKPGAEVHGYEPTPGDVARASEADLVIDNGLGLEDWFTKFLASADAPHLLATEGIVPIGIAGTDAPNPHAWMSTTNAEIYVNNIADAFAELAPEHAEDFRDNADDYSAQLRAVHDELTATLDVVPDAARALVTCEGAFSYLARDAGLDEYFLWPVNSEQEGTPRQTAAVIDVVLERGIPAVFCESTVSDAAMQQVVAQTGASFGGTLYVDSLSQADGPVPTYLDLLRHDAEVIAAALTGGAE